MPADRRRHAAPLIGACLLLAAGTGGADEADVPDEAFLEFLGTWEDAQGNWLDPLELEALARRVPDPVHDASDDDANDDASAAPDDEPVPKDDGLASDTSGVGDATDTIDDDATAPDEHTEDDSAS